MLNFGCQLNFGKKKSYPIKFKELNISEKINKLYKFYGTRIKLDNYKNEFFWGTYNKNYITNL